MVAKLFRAMLVLGVIGALICGGLYFMLRDSFNGLIEQALADQLEDQFYEQLNSGALTSNAAMQEKINAITSKVTVQDKAKVARIVLETLSVSQMNELRTQAQGGFTEAEKQEVKQIFVDNISEENFDEMKSIATKYAEPELSDANQEKLDQLKELNKEELTNKLNR